MIDSLLDEMENHDANLQACRLKPHVLDNDTVGRVIQVYSAQADDVWLFETQLYRWRDLNLTPARREEVDRRAVRIPTIADPDDQRANHSHPGFGRGVEEWHD